MLVLVETISMFKMKYVVDVPSKGNTEWAADTVIMQEAKEFSQKHIDEVIITHRQVSEDDLVNLLVEDDGPQAYTTWTKDEIKSILVTKVNEEGKVE